MRMLVGASIILAVVLPASAAPQRATDYSWAVAVFPSGTEVALEIASDAVSRWRGYRNREHVPPDAGMLFIFPSEQRMAFEMKDCRVALDMIFLDSAFRIVEIAHDQQPCPAGGPCPPVEPMRQARFVLEVAAGRALEQGLKPGDRITVLSEPKIP